MDEFITIKAKGLSTREALESTEEVEDVTLFTDLSIPDNIARAFLSRYPLEQLMVDIEKFDSPVFVQYVYNDLVYTGTIFAYKYGYPNTRRRLTLRLSHYGFRYKKRQFRREHIVRHKGEFAILDNALLAELPFISSLKERLGCDSVTPFYSMSHRRFDIRFNKGSDSLLMICFEPGHPVDSEERYDI